MLIRVLKSKIHRAAVTDKNLSYEGSIGIAQALVEKAGLREFEEVLVANLNTGERFETYVQLAPRGSGRIVLNGAAARLGEVGDRVIIMAFGYMQPDEAERFKPQVVLVNQANRAVSAPRRRSKSAK